MPKRLIDDSMLSSPSLARLSPSAQDAWVRFILMADDFGCLEGNPRILVGRGWPLRPEVTPEIVQGWIDEYIAHEMMEAWTEFDRHWLFLPGWYGPHGQRIRGEYDAQRNRHGSKRRTPVPPSQRTEPPLAAAPTVAGPQRLPLDRVIFPEADEGPHEPSEFITLRTQFFDLYQRTHNGETYMMTQADGVQLSALLKRMKTLSPAAAVQRITTAMVRAFEDRWFRDHASIKTFCAQFNSYRGSSQNGTPRALAAPSTAEEFENA